ncbi:LacI family DNA-binding transcriptional regulator [Bacillus sp. AL-1R]
MKRVTMIDVAKEAGVSKSTVSQFLNKRFEYMGEGTKHKIEEAVKRLGYQPNYIARSLKQKQTSMIGIIVANIMHSFSTEVSRAVEDYCHEHDLHVIVCNSYDDPVKEKKYIEMLRARQVDGLIIFPTGGNIELYKDLEEEKYPVVFIDRKIDDANVDTIVVNNKEATYDAVNYFIQNGHRNIAMITPPLITYPRMERLAGYKQALEDQGIEWNPDYVKSVEIKQMASELESMFSLSDKPTALLASNDLSFLEAMIFIKENNIRIPQDVSVIVFDNIQFANIYTPTITTISQPAYEMGKKAAELLLKQIKNESGCPDLYTFTCKLSIRESSTCNVRP